MKHINHSAIIYEHQLLIDEFHRIHIEVKRSFNVEKNYFPTYDEVIMFLNKYLLLNRLPTEYMYVIGFSGIKMTGVLEIGKGCENKCTYSNKDIVRYITLTGAGNFMVVHNHPIADCTPSITDLINHEQLKLIATTLELKFSNEFIISGNQYYDMENKCMRDLRR